MGVEPEIPRVAAVQGDLIVVFMPVITTLIDSVLPGFRR